MCRLLGIEPAANNGSLQAVQHQLIKEHKQDYTVLIYSSQCNFCFSSFVNELWYSVSFCVKNHCRIRHYGHIYDLGTSELFDL